MIALAALLILVLALMGAPLFVVVIAGAALGFVSMGTPLSVLHIDIYQLSDSVVLLALPLFTFVGYVLTEAKTADRLIRLSQAIFGWMPAGFTFVALVACAGFTALTGGSGVTIVALGALLLPALKKIGYSERFSLGLVTSSGSLGLLLAPSVPLLIYGIVAQQMSKNIPGMPPVNINDLYIAGIFPAILMIALLYMWSVWVTRHDPVPRQGFDFGELKSALWDMRYELPLPFVVLGGIFSGFLVISEAAAITALYVLIVEMFLYKEVTFKALPRVTRESMIMVGGILVIMGCAMALTDYLVYAGVPDLFINFVQEHVSSKIGFLVLLNIFLLIAGAALDIFPALIILIPLILPIGLRYGIDPIHLGIIFVANMQIAYIVPPIGMNLFIASYRFKEPVAKLISASFSFLLVLLISLLVITYVPELSLWLIR